MVCKYLIHMVRTPWVRTGLVSSGLDMSERKILYQKVLDLNFLGSKIFWVTKNSLIQNFLDSELFWNQIFFGSKFLVLIFLGTKI